jgi:hypothetical protein
MVYAPLHFVYRAEAFLLCTMFRTEFEVHVVIWTVIPSGASVFTSTLEIPKLLEPTRQTLRCHDSADHGLHAVKPGNITPGKVYFLYCLQTEVRQFT